MSDKKPQPITKHIEVGKFYFIHDKSKSGHPGLVVQKNDEENRYLVIRFDSDKPGEPTKESRGVRHITKLKHPTDANVTNSYARNRPFLCKRKDIGKCLEDLGIHADDRFIIESISEQKPEYSSSISKIKKLPRWTYSVPRTGCSNNIKTNNYSLVNI